MRKKLINFKGGKGSVSYGVILPKSLLESIRSEERRVGKEC